MGLDVVLLGQRGAQIGLLEIAEPLHRAIFTTAYWGSCHRLRRLRDYYRTNLRLTGEDVRALAQELASIRRYIDPQQHAALDALATALSDERVCAVAIAGD
ncbi:hypothetical protein F8S13_11320 [Chloroflexia bacterium SDU3-3]|nr:hypothetical protein F8S13_11320 [Chloroflexia bacterium SDU3-3]